MKEEINKNVEKLIEMVKGVRVCMLITNERNAENLSGRPMSISKIDDDGTIWFFTKSSSYKVDEIEESKKVSIAITNESSNNYLMIHATAKLVNDKTKMKVGYEIAFNKYFYQYEGLRSLSAIAADILLLEQKTDGLLKEIIE